MGGCIDVPDLWCSRGFKCVHSRFSIPVQAQERRKPTTRNCYRNQQSSVNVRQTNVDHIVDHNWQHFSTKLIWVSFNRLSCVIAYVHIIAHLTVISVIYLTCSAYSGQTRVRAHAHTPTYTEWHIDSSCWKPYFVQEWQERPHVSIRQLLALNVLFWLMSCCFPKPEYPECITHVRCAHSW